MKYLFIANAKLGKKGFKKGKVYDLKDDEFKALKRSCIKASEKSKVDGDNKIMTSESVSNKAK